MINYYDRVRAQPEIFTQLACKELLFVHYNCPLETGSMDKWSHHNYFIYILTGKKAYHTPGRSWLLTRGAAAFVKKGGTIIEKFFEEVLCIMTFFVPDSYLRSFLQENAGLDQKNDLPLANNDQVIPLEVNDVMKAYFESVLPYFHMETKPSENLLELKFRELLLHIITNPAYRQLHAYLQTLLLPRANSLQPIMEANCLYHLSLEDYARLCNRSLSSFKRDFQAVYHTAPGRWLLEKRLAYAHQLLLSSDKSIHELAFESGFENSTHFSRVFKERFGTAPLSYRRQALTV